MEHLDQGCNAGLLDAKKASWRTTIHERKTTKIIVSREMAVNDLVCKDINAGSLDLLMPSMMKKTWRQVDTRGRGSNDAGNDEDGGQQFRKWNKKTKLLYFDVGRESIDDHGHGYVVDPVGKAGNYLGQNHLILCHCEYTWKS